MSHVLIDAKQTPSRDKDAGRLLKSPVTIGVNAEFLANGRPDGIPRASFGLVRAMANEDGSITWLLFTPRIEWREAAEELRSLANCQIVVTGSMPGRAGRIFWRLFVLPWLAKRHCVDLLFNPVGNGPAWMPRCIPLVITMHDLAWLDGREWYSRGYRLGQRLLAGRASRLARQIFAVSNYSAKQIEERLQIGPDRVIVVHNGLGAVGSAKAPPLDSAGHASGTPGELHKPMALFVGTLIPRKNLLGVWRAFSRIREEKGLDVRLIVVGASRDAKALSAELKADPNVRFLDYVDDKRLAALYKAAAFLVLPSFYEGFGLPIIEAMALGTPVITSSSSALAEVAGDAALLVDPRDEEQIYSAMLWLFTDERLRMELAERGMARARLFTWDSSARVALAALRSLVLPASVQAF